MKTIRKLIIISFLLSTTIASAQTIIRAGKVKGNWTLRHSPYLIMGDIYVPENNVLIIEEGALVIFKTNSSMKIEGQLLAIGNEVDSITFTAERAEIGWAGIRWLNPVVIEDDVFSRLEYCKFTYAKSKGRFPLNYGGAIGIINTNNVIVSHCLFKNCEALNYGEAEAKGGAIALVNSDAKVSHCSFIDNTSKFGGAMLVVSGSNPVIDNCLFARNTALQFGGAVAVMEQSEPSFVNCTFADNYAEFGGGAIDLSFAVQVYVLNSIVWNNQSGRVLDPVSNRSENTAITFTHCNVEGGVDAVIPHPLTNKSIGNINVPPEFMRSGDHPYLISTTSPCIDAGITNTAFFPLGWNMPSGDLVNNFRVFDDNIDMGCYEYIFGSPIIPQPVKVETVVDESLEILVFPCPARSSVTFQYNINNQSNIRLLVFDMQGRVVAELLNNKQVAGIHKLQWDMSTLSKGTYIYKMNAGNQSYKGQILLVN